MRETGLGEPGGPGQRTGAPVSQAHWGIARSRLPAPNSTPSLHDLSAPANVPASESTQPIGRTCSTARLLPRTLLRTLGHATPRRAPHRTRRALPPRAPRSSPAERPESPPQTSPPPHAQSPTTSAASARPSHPRAGALTRGSRLSPGPGANGPRSRRRLRSGETWQCCPSGSASPCSPASTPEAERAGGAPGGSRRGAPLPALPPAARTPRPPRPGSRNHAAPPTASTYRGRHRLHLPRRGPSTPPRPGPSHLAGSQGPHSGGGREGGRAPPPGRLQEPRCPAEPLRRRARRSGERAGGAATPSDTEGVSRGRRAGQRAPVRQPQLYGEPSRCTESGRAGRCGPSPRPPHLVASAVSRLRTRVDFLSGFLGWSPGAFWDLRFWRAERPSCSAECLQVAPGNRPSGNPECSSGVPGHYR